MSDLSNLNTPGEALFNGAWGEDTTCLDPMDGPLDFDFDLPTASNVDLFGGATTEGGWADVQITDQTTSERTCTSPVANPLSSGGDLFGKTNEGAQAGVQSPVQRISGWSDPSPNAYNSSQAEQAQETVAGSTNETSGLTSTGPQGPVPALPVLPVSTTPQPQTVPDLSQGYWSSLLNGNDSTADPTALGNAQAPAGLATDLFGDVELDLQNFVRGPDPYPWGPLQDNYRGLDLPSEAAIDSSFIDPAEFASCGVQKSAGHTFLNPVVPTPATHPNLALPGEAVWSNPQVNCGNPINPGMTTVPWTTQAAVPTPSGPVYPIRAPGAAFAPPGTAESRAARLDLSLIDPDIMKEFKDTHGPMALGNAATPQPASAPTPAGSGTMPHLTAPMTPPVVPTRPIPERMPARVQAERHSRAMDAQSPAQGTVSPPPACYPGAAAWDDIERRKPMVLVHQRGAMEAHPSDVYRPLKATPKAWGPPMFKDLFTYTEHGEWHPSLRFAQKDLMYYIINARAQAKRPLKIWIQHCPAQRNYRYPNLHSSKCRWDECPANKNTILKGFYRVAFDEWSDVSGKVTDPFHNAGYMHLHCFEKLFDLLELIKYGFAELENRDFPHEDQNPMSVVQGNPQLTKTFRDWCYDHSAAYEKFQQEKARGGSQFRQIPKKQRLWSVLTDRYVKLESDARMKMRARRNGNSLDKHLGDLDVFVHGVEKRKALAKQARRRTWEEFESGESEPEEHDARVKRARLGKAPARMRVEDEFTSEDSEPEQLHARAKRARREKARTKRRVVVELDSDDSELEEKINRVKRAHHVSLAARKRAAEAVNDDGEFRPGENPPRVKCPPSSVRQVRSPSPAQSHITVQNNDEEELGPANEDPSHSSDDGEFEYED